MLVDVHHRHVWPHQPNPEVVAQIGCNTLAVAGVGLYRADGVPQLMRGQVDRAGCVVHEPQRVIGVQERRQGLRPDGVRVGHRLGLDRDDREPQRPGIVRRGERGRVRDEAARHAMPRPDPVVPQVTHGLAAQRWVGAGQRARLGVRAQRLQAGWRLDHLAVGEGHRPRPQEKPVAVGHVERAVHRCEPAHVTQHRHQPGHQGGPRPAPAHPGEQQVARDQNHQRQHGGPDDGGQAHQQADRGRPPQRWPGAGQQHRERPDHEHHGQQIGHDQVLDDQLRGIEQDRHGGQRGAPFRQAVPAQHGVHHARYYQSQHMLDSHHQFQRVERQQQPQEQ